MPCAYHINLDDGLVTISGADHVPIEESIALGRKMLADQDYDADLPHLIDLRGLVIERTKDQSIAFHDFVKGEYAINARGSVAVLVNDSLDNKSTAALYHLCSQFRHVEMFDNYELALRWLMRTEFATTAATTTPH